MILQILIHILQPILTIQTYKRHLPFIKKRKKKRKEIEKHFHIWPQPLYFSAGFLFCSDFTLKYTYIGWKAAGLQEKSCTPHCLTSKFLIFTCVADSFSDSPESKIQVTFCFNEMENISITKRLTKLQRNKANAFINVQFNYCVLERLLFVFFH